MAEYSLVEILSIGSASGAVGAGGVVWYMLKRSFGNCVTREEFDMQKQQEKQRTESIKEFIKAMNDSFKRELSLMAKSNSEQHEMIIKMLEQKNVS